MARIRTYDLDSLLEGTEKWIGSDSDNSTVNFKLDDVKDYIIAAIPDATPAPDQPEYLQDGVITGNIAWTHGLQYRTTTITCVIGGVYYVVPSQFVVLDNAHATLDRIDLITLRVPSVSGASVELRSITGQPAASPFEPTIPYGSREIRLSIATIEAAASVPLGVSLDLIYDENTGSPTEWDVTENTAGAAIVLNATDNPNTNTKSIKVDSTTLNDNNEITLTSDSTHPLSGLSSIHFNMELGALNGSVLSAGQNYMYVKIYNGSTQLGQEVRVKDNKNGLVSDTLDAYQDIIIPISDFKVPAGFSAVAAEITKIIFGFIGKVATSTIYIDSINLISGVDTAVETNTFISNIDTPDSFEGQEGKLLSVASDGSKRIEFINHVQGSTFGDNVFRIQDNGDSSKELAFEVSAITTATTRTITVQDSNGTMAYLSDITGLEALDEGNGIGFRLKGENPANFGNIGFHATDLSDQYLSLSYGATGYDSFAAGANTKASGDRSIALGDRCKAEGLGSVALGGQASIATNIDAVSVGGTASGQKSFTAGSGVASGEKAIALGNTPVAFGDGSVALGRGVEAQSFNEIALGSYNTTYVAASLIAWDATDRLLSVGNGASSGVKSDALIILKSGHSEFGGTVRTKGYTVATLPTGVEGDTAYVTDATAPTYLGALTGGGAVRCPVFKNATIWVSH